MSKIDKLIINESQTTDEKIVHIKSEFEKLGDDYDFVVTISKKNESKAEVICLGSPDQLIRMNNAAAKQILRVIEYAIIRSQQNDASGK